MATARRRWDDAEAALGPALDTARSIGEPRQTWQTRAALGRLHHARGQSDAAHRHYRAGRELVERILAGVREPGLRRGLEGSPDIQEILALGAAR